MSDHHFRNISEDEQAAGAASQVTHQRGVEGYPGAGNAEPVAHGRKKHKLKRKKRKKNRLVFWIQMLLVIFLLLGIGLTIRAMELVSVKSSGVSWMQELQQGHYALAADKFSVLASNAAGYVFDSNISTDALMRDFHAALPHLKRAGYTLTELEVELGIPPKLIPHFYHDPGVELHLQQSLADLQGNHIGTALMIALSKAGDLQKELEVSDMKFSHVEIELGPIPALKLQYKNNDAIGGYIHQ